MDSLNSPLLGPNAPGPVAVPEAIIARCQRWRAGRDSYRPAGELFDPSRAEVALIPEADAKAFTCFHHYSGSYPAARCRVGIFWKPSAFEKEHLAGVAVFSVPIQGAAIPCYLGVAPAHGVELGRFVLLDHLKANAETWFLARALRQMRKALPEVKGVISYSDPMSRFAADGTEVKRGHVGTIYKAGNALRHGQTKGRTLLLDPAGRVVNERSLSKVRLGERGADYAMRQLTDMGAPHRLPFEDGRAYVARVLASGCFRRVRHPGNFVFSWAFQ